jgi:hypothetical protein
VSTDRRIEVGVGLPNAGAGLQPGGGGAQPRPDADPGARERFEQALKAGGTAGEVAQGPSGLFSLFGSAAATPARGAQEHAALTSSVGTTVERLMVGDGRSGNKQVRIELKDDVLPGVSLTVQELDGRIQVDFFCSVEDSRMRLNEAASAQANELAQRLARDVLVRVQTDDEDDPCLLEAAASP